MELKLSTFNLENLGIRPGEDSPEARRKLPAHIQTLRSVLEELRPDVLCVQEVIDVEYLNNLTAGMGFTCREISRPPRNPLCTAVLSRFPIVSAKNVVQSSHVDARDIDADFSASIEVTFGRPVFEVEIDIEGKKLVLFGVHWKSKIPTALSSGAGQTWPWANFHEVAQGRLISEITRMSQAMGLRRLIDQRLAAEPDSLLAVAGDFNDIIESEALRMILGDARAVRTSELSNLELWPCESELLPEKAYTMIYRGMRQMLDHIFISKKLKERFLYADVNHNGMKPARDGSWSDPRPGSDHAPFSAVFDFGE